MQIDIITVNQFINKNGDGSYNVYIHILKDSKEHGHYEINYDNNTEEAEIMVDSYRKVLSDLSNCYVDLRSDLSKLLPVNRLKDLMLQNRLSYYNPNYIIGCLSLERPEFSYYRKEDWEYYEVHFIYGKLKLSDTTYNRGEKTRWFERI